MVFGKGAPSQILAKGILACAMNAGYGGSYGGRVLAMGIVR